MKRRVCLGRGSKGRVDEKEGLPGRVAFLRAAVTNDRNWVA